MIERIPEIKIEAYKNADNTLLVHYWQNGRGWMRDIVWTDFIGMDGAEYLMSRLFDYLLGRYPDAFRLANVDMEPSDNINTKTKVQSVRNFLSLYYSKDTLKYTEDDVDIVFYTNGEISVKQLRQVGKW